MMRKKTKLLTMTIGIVFLMSLACPSFAADIESVVTTDWLGQNLDKVVVLDIRKVEEYKAGHIPGAINRPYTEDVVTSSNKVATFRSPEALAEAYARIIPSKDTDVIIHCRTGHQASQTFFVLKHLLGYSRVRWYDAGWTEWAARPELPIVNETPAGTPVP